MRLDKFLSELNIGTRKQIKEYVKNGRCSVNGAPASKADMHIDENNDEIALYAAEDRGIELIVPIQDQLKDIRNSSFHYLAAKRCTDTTVIRMLFDQERDTYSQLVRKKYYSNNVYRYYSEEDTKKLLDFLYEKPAYVPAQIPAFKNLFNRTSAYMHNKIFTGIFRPSNIYYKRLSPNSTEKT